MSWAPWIGGLAVIGIIYGALCCLAQTDMKRLIAFSSVSHMGFVMLGIATLTTYGINAAVFGMVAHGLITGMLFFLAGSIQERYGTREIRRLGGILVQAPQLGWILGFCAMASLGLPGLAGFWGEFPAILSSYSPAGPAERPHRPVPGLHGHRRGRHRPGRRLPALDVPAHIHGRAEGRVRARPHPRRPRARVDRLDADAPADRGARQSFPNILFHTTDGAVQRTTTSRSRPLRRRWPQPAPSP